jgi:hypothetical protein
VKIRYSGIVSYFFAHVLHSFIQACARSPYCAMSDPLSSPGGELGAGGNKSSLFGNFTSKANNYHSRIPYIRKLPLSVIGIIVTVALVNIVVWAGVGVVLVCLPKREAVHQRMLKACVYKVNLDSISTPRCYLPQSFPIRWVFDMPWMRTTFPQSTS